MREYGACVVLSYTGRRLLVLALAIAGLAALAASDTVHAWVAEALVASRDLIAEHPRWGLGLFVVASALSAMLAFFSTAVVVPVAIHAWGELATVALLWGSWLLGGCCTYAIGRTLGHRVVRWLVSPRLVDEYAARLSARAGFFTILVFQLALPSEIPGYVLGILRYRFLVYLAALALAELPYAFGTVYLGESFIEQNYLMILGIGALGLVLIALAWLHLRRRLGKAESGRSPRHEPGVRELEPRHV